MTLAVHLRCCGHPPGTFDQQQLLLSGERGCISDRWDPVEQFFSGLFVCFVCLSQGDYFLMSHPSISAVETVQGGEKPPDWCVVTVDSDPGNSASTWLSWIESVVQLNILRKFSKVHIFSRKVQPKAVHAFCQVHTFCAMESVLITFRCSSMNSSVPKQISTNCLKVHDILLQSEWDR